MIDWPKPPSGTSAEAAWFRKLLECCRRLTLLRGDGYQIKESLNGITLTGIGGGTSVPSSPFQPYIITTLRNADYFSAKLYNWSTKMASGGEISIAKSITARLVPIASIDGNDIVYDYDVVPTKKDNIRSAQIVGIVSQFQVMDPRYLADDGSGILGNVIFACNVQGGTGVKDAAGAPVALQEFHTRDWAFQWNQSGTLP